MHDVADPSRCPLAIKQSVGGVVDYICWMCTTMIVSLIVKSYFFVRELICF